jgi:2-aminoadipate transaminase
MLSLQLQPESHVPLYIQIRDQLRARVHAGELRSGDRIPASRELATQLGVHRTTVANAYAELESEGLIEGHVGRGTFIADGIRPAGRPRPVAVTPPSNGGVRWESLFADERGEEALARLMPLGSRGEFSFLTAQAPPEHFPLAELRRVVNSVLGSAGREILRLGSADGYPPLKAALLELMRGEGMAVREGQLLITDGCQQSLDLLAKAFLRPGDSVLLENPTYPGAIAIFAAARVRSLPVPLRIEAGQGLGVDVEALEAALVQNRVKLMLLTPDFQNPTGGTMPVAARRRVLELAARHQVPVVEDHIYGRLRLRGTALPSLKALDRSGVAIQIDSFSKVAFPGLRVGWMVAPENVIERLRLVKQATDLHTDQLAQALLAEFTRRGGFARHLAKMRRLYASRLDALEQALARQMPEGVEWTRPEGGMNMWLTLPAGFDAGELLIHARERGVLFAPGRYFYFQSPPPNGLRLSYAALDERKIARGVALLAEALRVEIRKRERGGRRAAGARVALV